MALSAKDQAAVQKAAYQGLGSGAAGQAAATRAISAGNANPSTPYTGQELYTGTGQVLSPALPATQAPISSATLAQQSSVVLPTPKLPSNINAEATQGVAAQLAVAQQQAKTPEQKDSLASMMAQLVGTPQRESVLSSPEVSQAHQAQVQAQNEVAHQTELLNQIVTKQNQDLLSTRGQASKNGTTEAVYGGIANEINREAAIQSLPVAAAVAVAQGNLKLAQDHLQYMTAVVTEKVNNAYEYKVSLYNSIKDYVNKQEERQLDEMKTKAAYAHQDQQNNVNYAQGLATTAIGFGQKGVAEGIMKLLANPASPTFQADVAAYAGQLKDPMAGIDMQLKNAQLRNINSEINARNAANNPAVPFNYKGEFGATIDLAANAGGTTNQQRANIKNVLQTSIANKDYGSAYAGIQQVTSSGLKGVAASRFQEQTNTIGVLNDLQSAMQAYSNAGGKTDIFKGSADKVQTKIGTLMTDPKYASLAVQLGAAFQNYRLQMTGAAFGPQESAEYASILPSPGNTLDLNLAKLTGAKNYFNSSIESSIKSVVGQGGVYIKQYAEGAQQSAPQELLAPTQIPAGYYQASDGLLYKK